MYLISYMALIVWTIYFSGRFESFQNWPDIISNVSPCHISLLRISYQILQNLLGAARLQTQVSKPFLSCSNLQPFGQSSIALRAEKEKTLNGVFCTCILFIVQILFSVFFCTRIYILSQRCPSSLLRFVGSETPKSDQRV